MSYRKYRALAPLVAGVLLVVAACSDDGDDALVDNVSSGEDEGDDTEVGSGSEAEGDGETIDANVEGDPLATIDGSVAATPNDDTQLPFQLDVVRLARNGENVDLEIVLTNEHDTTSLAVYSQFSDGRSAAWDISGIKLVNEGDQRLYLPLLDSADECLCTTGLANTKIDPGTSVKMYAIFGGLPADLSSVDIHVPNFSPINGVPVAG